MVCNADDNAARKDNSQGFIHLSKNMHRYGIGLAGQANTGPAEGCWKRSG